MLIKNARVVAESGTFTGDIRITGEVFAELGNGLSPHDGEKLIDAENRLVLPGGVDAHTHMDLKMFNARACDDFFTGTVAAACGGTTTIIDHMAFGEKGFTIKSRLDEYHSLAGGNAVIDYGFHGVMDHVDDNILKEVEELAENGVTSHKFYLTYDGKVTDGEVFALMRKASELGVLLTVHCENDGVVGLLRREFSQSGKTQPVYHAKSRPPECEAEAVNRMILFAHMADDAPLYIVHLTNELAMGFIEAARSRGQRRLFAETCPQYLLLDESLYLEPDGLKYVMSPPLRKKSDRDALWNALKNGVIDTVATDHCPFLYGKEKQLGKDDFTKTPNGSPGVEARLMLMYSEGVAKNRLTVEQMAELCSTRPAKLFGIYPKKGVIAVGSDADFVMLDTENKITLTKPMLHENCDYTPYEGFEITGLPVLTVSRGEIVAENGKFVGKKGAGRFLERKLPDLSSR